MGPNVVEYMMKSKNHIIGLVETHLNKDRSKQAVKDFNANRWTACAAAATPSNTNKKGNHGGAFMAHKSWLQTTTPIEAEGKNGSEMPDADLIYKYFRTKGKTICMAFAYFEHSIGMKDGNIEKVKQIERLRDNGNCEVIVAGDFNMKPQEWNDDILDKLDMQIIAPNAAFTCTNNSENSLIDYVLVSRSIAPMIKELRTVGGDDQEKVPWAPHLGIQFELHAEADTLWSREQIKPHPITIKKDKKNNDIRWDFDSEEWFKLLEKAESKAEDHITRKYDEHQKQHTKRMGNEKEANELGISYAQWSMAAEEAQAKANDHDIKNNQRGRGCTPQFAWRNQYDKSQDRPVQHHQWEMQNKFAVKGADLYSTTWATIASTLRRMARESKKMSKQDFFQRAHVRDHPFLEYLTLHPKSP